MAEAVGLVDVAAMAATVATGVARVAWAATAGSARRPDHSMDIRGEPSRACAFHENEHSLRMCMATARSVKTEHGVKGSKREA